MSSARSLISTIAGFSAIGFAVLSLVYGFFIVVPKPEIINPTTWDWTLRILVILMIVSFSVYLLAAPETLGDVATRRSTRFTANALIAALVAIGVVILLNVLADRFATASADLTAAQTFSLSDQTKKVLSELDGNVKAIAFYNPQGGSTVTSEQISDLLTAYKSNSNGHLTTELVDYYRDPGRTAAYLQSASGGIQFPAVVFDNGTKRETTHDVTEAGFTTALIKLGQNVTPTVGFLIGHGERDSNSYDQGGYGQARQQLEKENYVIKTVNLLTGTLTVSDTNVLVIAEPQRALSAKEVQTIQQYLDSGGHAMILVDTLEPTEAFDSLKPIMQKYGVTPMSGAVVDVQSIPQAGPYAVLVNSYPSSSEITAALQRQKLNTLFYISAGLQPPTSTVNNMQVTSIIQSSVGEEKSFLETAINSGSTSVPEVKYDAGKDLPGPVSMGVTIEPQDTATNTVKTRLVIYGDSDMPSNFITQQYPYNLDLFANSISWLSGANELVSIRAKDPEAPRQVVLDSNQQIAVFFAGVLGLPFLVMLAGAFIWWRRR
jgi:ABC-type uncharacterized transport system involved in gliding motility auxiliary subunit